MSRGDERGLDAYLLLHAAASADPWDCTWPSDTWVHLLALASTTSGDSTKAAVSKVFARLDKTHHLVDVGRVGRRSSVVLLKEDGSGDAYTRPVTKEDAWFNLPHAYFLKGFDQSLSLPAKAMLLVALHLKDGAWLPSTRAKDWFGISPTTAREGLAELVAEGLLQETRTFTPDVRSPTLWTEKVTYRRAGPMRPARRAKAAEPVKSETRGTPPEKTPVPAKRPTPVSAQRAKVTVPVKKTKPVKQAAPARDATTRTDATKPRRVIKKNPTRKKTQEP